jgi:hypothetical protein
MLRKDLSMATDSPTPTPVILQGTPEVQIKGFPSYAKMVMWLVGTAIAVVIAILGGEHFMLANSLKALDAQMGERSAKSEASLKETIGHSIASLNEDQAYTRGVVRRLLTASTLPQNEKNDLGKGLALGTIKLVVHSAPKNSDTRSLESLVRTKQIERREVSKFTWNDGMNEGQIRYFELLDPKLDISKIDLYSEGDKDRCESKVLDVPGIDGVVEACETHLDSKGRLELIVIRNAE